MADSAGVRMIRGLALFTMLALTASTAQAGKKKRQGREPSVPDVPSAVSLPADRAPVHADVTEAPALLGSNLDLASLSRTKITWTIGSDLSFLDELDVDLLVTQLAADPRWRVGREEGGLVAVARAQEGKTWSMPWHGYQIEEDACRRTGLTFEPRTRAWAWDDSEVVAHSALADAEHTITALRLLGDSCLGQTATALVIRGGITVEIFESGGEAERPHTVGVFDGLQKLREVPFSTALIEKKGYSKHLMPEDGIRGGHASLALDRTDSGLVLEAWQNPGAAGWSWLRILDSRLRPWEEEAVATATLERVGSSPDVQELFLMTAEIPLPEGKGFGGTAEIWTLADGEKTPTRVDSVPIRIPTR